MITFSHVHETEAYKSEMLNDLETLGYDHHHLLAALRIKAVVFIWNPEYRIRTDAGEILPGLKIRDLRKNQFLELEKYDHPLLEYPEFEKSRGFLLARDFGWELDLPFHNFEELSKLTNLFLKKAGATLYDQEGLETPETPKEKVQRSPWPDAYEVPVIIIGEEAERHASKLPHF